MIKQITNELWRSPIYKWHRYIGLTAAFFFLFLAVSGVALNHTEKLKLDERYVASEWLLDWYGIAPRTDAVSYEVDGRYWITGLEGQLYLDGKHVAGITGKLLGAVKTGGMFVIAAKREILLLTPDGEPVERLPRSAIPASVQRIGVTSKGRVRIETLEGGFLADAGLIIWEASDISASWSTASRAPDEVLEAVRQVYRGRGLSWERVLFDLHSGRLLGAWGPYLMDGVAILLLVLVGTGLYMTFARRP